MIPAITLGHQASIGVASSPPSREGFCSPLAERKLCVCLTLIHCPLLSFRVGWGCGEVAGRREEGWEGFIVFESFLLLCSIASEGFGSGGVTTRPWAA